MPFVTLARVLLVAALLGGCASRSDPLRHESVATLHVTVDRRITEVPSTVQFMVYVDGGRDDDPRLYCPDIHWDFGEAQFLDSRDCPPFEDGARIQRAYQTERTFDKEGLFEVTVTLLHRSRPVLRASTAFQVRRTGIGVRR